MIATGSVKETDALWIQVHKNNDQIGGIKTEVAETSATIAALIRQMDRQFKEQATLIENNRPSSTPLLQLAVFCVAVLGLFGGSMTYVTNINSEALEREIDLRIQAVEAQSSITYNAFSENIHAVNRQIEDVQASMKVDDQREQTDMYDKGWAEAHSMLIRKDFNQLDRDLYNRNRERVVSEKNLHGRLRAIEEIFYIDGEVVE